MKQGPRHFKTMRGDARVAAPWCQHCNRATPDPVIGLLGDRIAFACPHCSAPEVLALWEAEAS